MLQRRRGRSAIAGALTWRAIASLRGTHVHLCDPPAPCLVLAWYLNLSFHVLLWRPRSARAAAVILFGAVCGRRRRGVLNMRRAVFVRACWPALVLLSATETRAWTVTAACTMCCRRTPSVCMATADSGSDGSSARAEDLWADFDAAMDASGRTVVVEDDDAAAAEDDDDPNWDEPTGNEAANPDATSIADFIPLIMQKKYGDEWEVLAGVDLYGDDADGSADADADSATTAAADADPALSYVDEVTHGAEDEAADPAAVAAEEAELRKLIETVTSDDDDDDVAAGGGYDGDGEADVDDRNVFDGKSPEEIAALVSTKLATFLHETGDGGSKPPLPQPFPASEWLHIYVAALSFDTRFDELQSTWANLRVLIAENFDDLTVGEDPAAEPDAEGSALRKARALHAATGLPAIAETTCCYVAGASRHVQWGRVAYWAARQRRVLSPPPPRSPQIDCAASPLAK